MDWFFLRLWRVARTAALAAFIGSLFLPSAASARTLPKTPHPANSPALAVSREPTVSVLVVYCSATGNTEKMAKAVAQGAQKVPGTTVSVKTVKEVTASDLTAANAIVLGSPTYFGNIAGPMKVFIDDWFFKYKVPLIDKVGGAFSTGAAETGGKEHVIYSLVIAMMNAGMIVAGPLESSFGVAGASAVDPVNEAALKEARALGEHVADVARRLKTEVH